MKKISSNTIDTIGYSLLAVVVVLAGIYFFNSVSEKGKGVEPAPVSLDDNILGGEEVKVVLVEYGDFQCPACKNYEPIVQGLLNNHKKDIQFVFRHFPLTSIHKNALLSAKFAEAAGIQGKFWEAHDMLYANQENWSEKLNAKEILLEYAKGLNLDVSKLVIDMESKSIEEKIFAQYKEGISVGVKGTPTFFVNGVKINNPQTVEAFEKIIKEAQK